MIRHICLRMCLAFNFLLLPFLGLLISLLRRFVFDITSLPWWAKSDLKLDDAMVSEKWKDYMPSFNNFAWIEIVKFGNQNKKANDNKSKTKQENKQTLK